ncbi:hypothetical protein P8C59_007965 [Phyllachora maydis]|uniref:Uncharacterized protein n=1 Tax=Phyllachora maydis TaxID=1825666 RepID=A0AAD9IBA6_9PEZI|nr:hypothetical protein P8C59_007965 [Phyllachora maydis]
MEEHFHGSKPSQEESILLTLRNLVHSAKYMPCIHLHGRYQAMNRAKSSSTQVSMQILRSPFSSFPMTLSDANLKLNLMRSLIYAKSCEKFPWSHVVSNGNMS